MKPDSTVSIITLSKVSQKTLSYSLLSNLALCKRPLVQAKIDAIELVEVVYPFKKNKEIK
jgi:hypothetical protein